MTHRLALMLAAALCTGAAQAARDDALWQAAERAQPAVVASLKTMVQIESGSSNAAGIASMADFTEARLKALGAKTERVAPMRGHGTMVKGTFDGQGRKRFMLIAHMDTVYAPGILATQPIKESGNKLYGPGIADDKGGIAVILHSLEILRAAGWADYARLTVLFNADEEIGSIGSGEAIATLADQHDVVLSYEPTGAKSAGSGEAVLLGASGTATATMEVTGKASHAGAAPELGRNALIELSHQLIETRDVAKGVPGTQLNWTTATAGVVRNQIPERAVATGDVRLTVKDGAGKLQAALEQQVAKGRLVPDTTTRITMEPGRPPFIANDAGRALANEAKRIYAELDRPLAIAEHTGGATDAGFAGRSGKATVIESMGLPGAGYHARDEYVEVDAIAPRLYLTMRLLQDTAKAP